VSGPIVVVNPNSNKDVTDGLDAALKAFRLRGGPPILCVTLEDGPRAIESAQDAAIVVRHLVRLVSERPDAAAFVIACYSDPGVDACREVTRTPVYGIQECGVMAALARVDRIGVIALSDHSIRGHRRHLRRLGLLDRLVGERAAALSVADSAGEAAFGALREAGRALVSDGAEAVVLGCAGMARHRAGLEWALGVPVIEPTQAAVAMALGAALAAG
jgi:Asp/Glu/hydantoin racemase